MPPETVHDLKPPRIIHYVDGPKPWAPFELKWLPKTSIMFKRFPRYAEYRRNAKRLLAPCRAAVDEAVSASYLAPLDGAKCKEGGHGTAFRSPCAPTWLSSSMHGSPWRRRSNALNLPCPCIFSETA